MKGKDKNFEKKYRPFPFNDCAKFTAGSFMREFTGHWNRNIQKHACLVR